MLLCSGEQGAENEDMVAPRYGRRGFMVDVRERTAEVFESVQTEHCGVGGRSERGKEERRCRD